MKCEPKEAAAIAESMELTKAEVDKIQTMKRGTCLLVANQNHIFIDVKATPMEHDLITTDREDLQRIARKNAEARVFPVSYTHLGLTRSPSFREIRSTIDRQAEGIRQTMALCGNEMISKENDDQYILEALYSIMSRAQSEERPFEQRQADVVARYAGADNIDFLAHPNIQLPVNDFIAPEYIDTEASPKYIVIDGTYYLFCYLPSDAYPVRAIAGWMQLFVGMGEGIDVDLWLHKEMCIRDSSTCRAH